MKKLGAVLLIAGVFVVGGAAVAGQDDKCTICHLPSDSEIGDYIVVSANAWRTSPHAAHGDCRYYGPDFAGPKDVGPEAMDVVEEEEVVGCMCAELQPAPDPTDPPPTVP